MFRKKNEKKTEQEKKKEKKKTNRKDKKKRMEALPEHSRYKRTKNHGKTHLKNRYVIFNVKQTISRNISYPSYGWKNYNYLQKDTQEAGIPTAV